MCCSFDIKKNPQQTKRHILENEVEFCNRSLFAMNNYYDTHSALLWYTFCTMFYILFNHFNIFISTLLLHILTKPAIIKFSLSSTSIKMANKGRNMEDYHMFVYYCIYSYCCCWDTVFTWMQDLSSKTNPQIKHFCQGKNVFIQIYDNPPKKEDYQEEIFYY
jgi:hypothetical protein